MTTIVLGCDRNGVHDAQDRDIVYHCLKQAGFTVEKLPIHPTPFGSYGYSKQAEGKIGVYMMAASLVSVTDLASSGWKFKYTYFIIRKLPGLMMQSQNDFNSKPIHKDDDGDCTNSYCDKWQGKTYPQINNIIGGKGKVFFAPTPAEGGATLVSLLQGQDISATGSSFGSSQAGSGSNTSPLLQGDMTFEELVGEICNGIDLMFLCKRSTVVVTDFETIFAEAKYLRDNYNSSVKGENINLWQIEEDSFELNVNQHGFYNTVYVKYKNGTVKESFDDLVKVYGEVSITYTDLGVDKTTAIMKAKAYLAAHMRDLELAINTTMLTEPDIDIGDIITIPNPQTTTNDVKALQKLDPEFLFTKGINTSWEGDGYISTDIECQFSPTSPKKLEVPTTGTIDTSSSDENIEQ